MSRERLIAWLLRKLMRSGYWKRRHCGIDDILRPLRHDEKARKMLKTDIIPVLYRENILIQHHGDRYSLNNEKKVTIIQMIEKYYP